MAETTTLKVGDEAPDFELPASPTGDKFKLSDYRGKQAVVINFVPAAFSPVCNDQGKVIAQKQQEFADQDALPVVVSVDGPWAQKAWREQMGFEFPVLSDVNPQGATAQKYGVFIDERKVANRVVVVVDKHGKVAWIQPAPKPIELPDYDPVMACSKE